jgi:hypothetical protein
MNLIVYHKGQQYTIKIHNVFKWLIPYIKKARQLGVPIWEIDRIDGYFVPKNRLEQQSASCNRNVKLRFRIMLLTKYQNQKSIGNGKFIISGWSNHKSKSNFESTIDFLAHELAHVVHWEHTEDRYILEKQLQLSFARLSKKMGYKGFRG